MPYVRPWARVMFDDSIDAVVGRFENMDDNDYRDGCLNYVISSIIDKIYERNYREFNAAIGVLECCKLELYRQVVAPYEDTKIIENGDVYT